MTLSELIKTLQEMEKEQHVETEVTIITVTPTNLGDPSALLIKIEKRGVKNAQS